MILPPVVGRPGFLCRLLVPRKLPLRIARDAVVKPGRTLIVCRAHTFVEIAEGEMRLSAIAQGSIAAVHAWALRGVGRNRHRTMDAVIPLVEHGPNAVETADALVGSMVNTGPLPEVMETNVDHIH